MQEWNNEETQKFLNRVRECLNNMTQWQKDCWIMNQAKLENINEYESFIKSLYGEMDILCIPEDKEIDIFCEKAGVCRPVVSGEWRGMHERSSSALS